MTSARRRSLRPLAGRVKRGLHRRLRPPAPDPDPQRTAWLDGAQQLAAQGGYDDAEAMLDTALAARPGDLMVLTARARLDGQRGDWETSAERWRTLVAERADDLGALGWVSATHAHRRIRDTARAAAIVAQGLELFPRRKMVLWEAGHTAMALGDWPLAASRWATYSQVQAAKGVSGELPLRAGMADWFEAGWHDVAESLDAAEATTGPLGAAFHLGLAHVLSRAELPDDEIQVLRRGVAAHPDDIDLALALTSARMARGESDVPLPIDAAEIAHVLDALPSYPASTGAGLGPIRLLRVPERSSIALALRTGHYVDRPAVGRLIQELSERDRWPEPIAKTNELLAQAHAWTRRYGAKYAEPPHLPAETLGDALLASVHHEMALFVPMQRLAAELAARAGDAPVVIETPELSPGYLGGYLDGDFDLAVLYFALLDLGCNAFLCHVEPQSPGRAAATFSFSPRWRSAKSDLVVVDDPAPHTRALVPAGIRRVGQLAARLEDVVVYQSGSVIKDFAYDRSIHQDYPIVATGRLHPEETLLPTFDFPLTRQAQIKGRDLGSARGRGIHATLEVSEPVGGTWPQWLHRATAPLLRHVATVASEDIARRGITEAHVGDHLFVENVIVGDAVKRAGGRVVIWPHSTNPVHVKLHRPESFDEVHAITNRGADQWRAAFPDKLVIHSPDSMLTQAPPRAFDPAHPLSLVLFGGRSVLGDMPILDTHAHRDLYLRLFDLLEELRATHPVDVYFKPRGLTGEHEQWLYTMVGRKAGWRPVYEHPLRLELPNMVFASVSMGTSALIEGLARGIPGLIVREFPVRDYVTLSEDTFPILPATKAMELLAGITSVEGYADLITRELRDHRDELGM